MTYQPAFEKVRSCSRAENPIRNLVGRPALHREARLWPDKYGVAAWHSASWTSIGTIPKLRNIRSVVSRSKNITVWESRARYALIFNTELVEAVALLT